MTAGHWGAQQEEETGRERGRKRGEVVMCQCWNESSKVAICVSERKRDSQKESGGWGCLECFCCQFSSHRLMSLLQMELPLSAHCPPPPHPPLHYPPFFPYSLLVQEKRKKRRKRREIKRKKNVWKICNVTKNIKKRRGATMQGREGD